MPMGLSTKSDSHYCQMPPATVVSISSRHPGKAERLHVLASKHDMRWLAGIAVGVGGKEQDREGRLVLVVDLCLPPLHPILVNRRRLTATNLERKIAESASSWLLAGVDVSLALMWRESLLLCPAWLERQIRTRSRPRRGIDDDAHGGLCRCSVCRLRCRGVASVWRDV